MPDLKSVEAPFDERPDRYFDFQSPIVFCWVSVIQANVPVGIDTGPTIFLPPSDSAFAIGVRQPDNEVGYKPFGVSDAVWTRRVNESRGELNNFALYNAPPGTEQRMPVYLSGIVDSGSGRKIR